ncbi:ABC transporter ATP-binding protein [Oceanobacillus alkalisoli]|uniref:ABC transporter ATP-binding protein n=1 Tax=Oceanobacillus alkalisoli TaxID=2925113 RepID=UPI001F12062A|nr:ATP-binding cassette domain-containing protein [Oceanobacillus alkalisoli]MCF3944492.1 ATP-binding cassette domain-containing protein [Oceanobacillus alkalisoli]
MIKTENLTKKFGDKTAVDRLNLTLQPGAVTGFLGPNGSGKSTTMKMIISLVQPTHGKVIIDGKKYSDFREPVKKIGTLIDPSTLDKNFTAEQHLSIIATAAGIEKSRIEEMLDVTGLQSVKNKKVKSYSLGMKQRLGVATALIGNPDTIILDEPFNGLDIDGIKWLRKLFRQLADHGKAVIVSSHLMREIEAVADRVVIIGQGKLLADMTMGEMNEKSLSSYVYVEANDIAKFKNVLQKKHALIKPHNAGLKVRNLEASEIGRLAHDHQIILFQLTKVNPSLEDLFTEITDGKVEYVAKGVKTK